jgi:hypothetical protein
LLVTGAAAFAGGINVTAGGQTFTTGIGGNGLTVDNIKANYSIGVGQNATGVAGQLGVSSAVQVGVATGGYVAGCVNASTNLLVNNASIGIVGGVYTGNLQVTGDMKCNTLHVVAAAAMSGGLTITASGLAVTGGITVDNVAISVSLGVGTGASGTAGRIDATGIGAFGGALSGSTLTSAGALTVAGAVTGVTSLTASGLGIFGSVNGGTITSSVDLIANGTFHANGASAFTSGGVNITAGGMTFTAGVVGNGLQVDNITINTSLGVGGTANGIATGVVGEVNVRTDIKVAGTTLTVP